MKKKYFYAIASGIFAVVFFELKIQIWILFAGMALYFICIKKEKKYPTMSGDQLGAVVYGSLGDYAVDGDGQDLSYGLYIDLGGDPVFIDIKKDTYVEERKTRAQMLFKRQEELKANLVRFIEENPEFKNSKIHAIGLHAKDIEQGEVFWLPNGYTLLRGLEFVPN